MLTSSLEGATFFPNDIHSYRKLKLIGRGAFGQVYEATIGTSAERYAIKIVDKLLLCTPDMMRRLRNEVAIHSSLSHAHILTLHHYFEDAKAMYLVMEYCEEGELYQLLKREPSGRLTESECRNLFLDVVRGVQYLHNTVGVIHRDLKLSNILLTRDSRQQRHAKIGDFGLACRLHDPSSDWSSPHREQLTICGTPNYLAPEIVQKKPYGKEADLWSLGCLLYTMLVGRAPFEGRDLRATFARVNSGQYEVPEFISRSAKDLLSGLMKADPKHRLTLEQIVEHPFILNADPLLYLPARQFFPTSDSISTSRLKPLKQTIKHGCIEVDSTGRVVFTVDSDRSVMIVSKDGQHITFTDASGKSESCRFLELGRAARKRYDYMRRFVELVRSKTPLIVLRTDSFKLVLMGSQGGADVSMSIGSDGNITYNQFTDIVTVSLLHRSKFEFYHPTYRSIEQIDDSLIRKWLLEFLARLEQLKKILASLVDSNVECPFVIDETTSLPVTPSYITSSVRSFESGQLSGISALRTSTVLDPTLIRTTFFKNAGWMVHLRDDLDLLLAVDGSSVRVKPKSGMVSIDGQWVRMDSSAVGSPVFKILQSFHLVNKQ